MYPFSTEQVNLLEEVFESQGPNGNTSSFQDAIIFRLVVLIQRAEQ